MSDLPICAACKSANVAAGVDRPWSCVDCEATSIDGVTWESPLAPLSVRIKREIARYRASVPPEALEYDDYESGRIHGMQWALDELERAR